MSRLQKRPRCLSALPIAAASLYAFAPLAGSGIDDQGTGPIGLADLIALGLKNNPALIAKRGEIPIAEARKRAARDWPDPQIRVGTSWGYNNVPPSYEEIRQESFTQHGNRTQIDENGKVTTSKITETVDRTTQRKVTPGRDATVTEEKIHERSREGTSTDPNTFFGDQGGNSLDNQSFSRSGTESRFHEIDPFASERDLSLRLRFYVPHPKRRKAQLERAQQEIDLARSAALAEEHEVVLDIREEYEQLQYLKQRIDLLRNRNSPAEKFDELQNKLYEDKIITIDKIKFIDVDTFAVHRSQAEFEGARDRLAARVGLRDGSRIRVTDKLVSPAVNLNHTHLDYLIEMAFAHRAELALVLGKGRIAEADLKEAKAKNMPWFDYFQAEFGRAEQGGNQTGTAWGVQFALSLPIFTWFGHEQEIYEAAIASYYAQKEANQGVITGEVAAAYKNVQRASKLRGLARSKAVSQRSRNMAYLEKINKLDQLSYEEARYDMARGAYNADEHRLWAEHNYNQALIQLELSLGIPLDRVLDGGGKAVEAVESAAPATRTPPAPREDTNKPQAAPNKDTTPSAEPRATDDVAKKQGRLRLRGIFKSRADRKKSGFSPHK